MINCVSLSVETRSDLLQSHRKDVRGGLKYSVVLRWLKKATRAREGFFWVQRAVQVSKHTPLS